MRLHLTVAYRAGAPPWSTDGDTNGVHEVEVQAPEGCTTRELVRALAAPEDPHVDRVLAVSGTVVDDEAVVGLPPLVDGAALVLTTADDPSLAAASTSSSRPRTPVTVAVTHGPDAGHVRELPVGRHLVGRSPAAHLRLDDGGLSRLHAEIEVGPDGVTVRDLGSTNGSLLDGRRLGEVAVTFTAGSTLAVGASSLVLGVRPSIPAATVRRADGTRAVNRRPRVRDDQAAPALALPTPPSPPRPLRVPWVAVLLPIPVAGVMAVFLGPTMLAFALMGPVIMVGSALSDRWGARRTHEAELANHATLLREAQGRVDDACATEVRAATRSHPDPAALLALASGPGDRLWERCAADADLLTVAIGRCTRPARVRVMRPPGEDGPEHPTLHDAPCTVPLDAVGVLGVCGDVASRSPVARQVVGRLVTLASPHDLELAVVTSDADASERWGWLLRLPHLRTADGGVRPAATGTAPATPGSQDTAAVCFATLADIVRTRRAQLATSPGRTGPWSGSRVLLVVDGAARFRGNQELGTILADGPAVGVVTLALDRDGTHLPAEARAVLAVGGGEPPLLDLDGHRHQDLVLDGVGAWWSDRLSRSLAGLRDASPVAAALALPTSAGLLPLCDLTPATSGAQEGHVDPSVLAARWQRTPHRTDVPLGVSGGEPLRVDLATDGPHVLVAGTTGAGKSELLRTLVASLALHHRPEHLSLVLVDYKGGAAFRECADLPHVAGVVTDLDGSLADRALRSLTAELTRRERLLAAAGASDFVAYQGSEAGRRTPLARLVVVIDEFRALAEELPAFVDGLVRLAALGRSLGIHLVLATQRPAGVVTADIKANVNLRIALRVRDRADSEDVIDAPDAASLDQSLPGRAFARVGGGGLVRFQAAHVGRPVTRQTLAGPRVRPLGLGAASPPWPCAGTDEAPTELAAVVAAVRGASDLLLASPPPAAWLPPLPTHLDHAELLGAGPERPRDVQAGTPHRGYRVPLGLVDRPDTQSQEHLDLDLRRPGHWAFVGSAGSGRTNALLTAAQALAARRGPTELHLYAVSGGSLSPLTTFPQLGAHVDWTDSARLGRLVDRLAAEVARRREALQSQGYSSMQHWWDADDADDAPPPLVVLVDDWDLLVHHTDAAGISGGVPALGTLADRLLAVLREGDGLGLTALLSGDRSLLVGRGAAAAAHRVVLRLTDRGDAAVAGVPESMTSAAIPPGRGRLHDRAEVQLALPPTVEPQRTTRAGGRLPWRVDALPDRLGADDLDRTGTPAGALAVGAGGDEGQTLSLRPGTDGRRWLVAGARGAGVSTTLLHLAQELLRQQHTVAVVSPRPGPLDVLRQDDRIAWCGADPEALVVARRRNPCLAVVVDAGDELLDHPVEQVLREVLLLVDRDEGLVVVGADAAALSAMYRGVVVEVARHRTGVLLGAASAAQGEVLGTRVPVDRGARPGRGHLVLRGEVTPLQVALPTARPSAPAAAQPSGPATAQPSEPATGRTPGPATAGAPGATRAAPG
ncbi:FtsK/SpoIIIE domain-containing protein [Pedococcus sp. 2YAF34]|uniref:FtsK/SpoIIIE domain-containing protein n=1 Tax=Pedococcus sp. 2YAF34 TaxID=3233032 RepID=UPI003F9CACE4